MNNQQSTPSSSRKIKLSSRKIVPLIALSIFLIAIIPVYYPFLNNIIYSPKASDDSQSSSSTSISLIFSNPDQDAPPPLTQQLIDQEELIGKSPAAATAVVEEKVVPPTQEAAVLPIQQQPQPQQSELETTVNRDDEEVVLEVAAPINNNIKKDEVDAAVVVKDDQKEQRRRPSKSTSRRSRRNRGGGRKRKKGAVRNRDRRSTGKRTGVTTTTTTNVMQKEEEVEKEGSSINEEMRKKEEEEGSTVTEAAVRIKEEEEDERRINKAEEMRRKESCDLSLGEWVPNPEGPYYTNDTCSTIQEHQNCMKFGRPDTGFLKWRWKPQGCDLPIFDPLHFLEIMTGKKMAFVGDSVARNHMQSLICLLSKVEEAVDVSEIPYWSQFKRYEFKKYKLTIAIFWSPYLVRTSQEDPGVKNSETRPFNLFLDEPDPKWTQQIPGFDYLIISAGHWFFRPTMFYIQARLAGCLYCPQSNITHLTSYFSYRRAFRTALQSIIHQQNFTGITFLRSFAPSHFENGYWDKGGDCVRQRPYRADQTRLDGYNMEHYRIQLDELKIAQRMGRGRGLKFRMMDVTRAMLMRPDGHPSRYGHWPTPNVTLVSDCVHWCLPGPVDSWNDFLIELLRREEELDRLQSI